MIFLHGTVGSTKFLNILNSIDGNTHMTKHTVLYCWYPSTLYWKSSLVLMISSTALNIIQSTDDISPWYWLFPPHNRTTSTVLMVLSHNRTTSTVLMVSLHSTITYILNILQHKLIISLHSTEHPQQYWWYPPKVLTTLLCNDSFTPPPQYWWYPTTVQNIPHSTVYIPKSY